MRPTSRQEGRERIELLCAPLLEANGFELVDAEWHRHRRSSAVRLFIHKEGGVTIGDCHKAHKLVAPMLETEGVIDERTSLEIASPGLDRPLRRASDFRRAEGHFVVLRKRREDDPDREDRLVGKVMEVSDDTVTLALDEGGIASTPLSDVIEGRFDIRF